MAEEVKLDRKEIKELEKFIIKRIEEIVFGTNRPSGVQKKVGGLKIQDSVGGNQKLRKSIQRNKSFIKQGESGLEINIKNLPPYWKYLDDERVNDYNWYLTEAIFDDETISKKIKEVMTGAYKRYIINILKE
jgi:hypothetical protein